MAEGHRQRLEENYNLQWNQTRHLMALFKNIYRGKDDRAYTPEQVWPLSIDKKVKRPKPKYLDKEAQEELIKKSEARRTGKQS